MQIVVLKHCIYNHWQYQICVYDIISFMHWKSLQCGLSSNQSDYSNGYNAQHLFSDIPVRYGDKLIFKMINASLKNITVDRLRFIIDDIQLMRSSEISLPSENTKYVMEFEVDATFKIMDTGGDAGLSNGRGLHDDEFYEHAKYTKNDKDSTSSFA